MTGVIIEIQDEFISWLVHTSKRWWIWLLWTTSI